MSRKRVHAWRVLVDRGYFPDRKTAGAWIMAGKVIADDVRVDKAGSLIVPEAEIRIRATEHSYVGKGGVKLEGAIQTFGLSVLGRVCLDCGASTGGFTDCLLRHGAGRVYAVDVGYGQLAGRLRNDERVVTMERTNIADIDVGDLNPHPDLAVADLSYLSLTKAIPQIRSLMSERGRMVCLVKPLFEVSDRRLRREGALLDHGAYVEILEQLAAFVSDVGMRVQGVAGSPVRGARGTCEFFILVNCASNSGRPERSGLSKEIRSAVDSVLSMSESR